MHIANKLNRTIYNMISIRDFHIELNIDDISKPRKHSKITKIEMERHLRDAAYTKTIPKSLSEVCREGGFSVRAAKNNFPKLSQLILDNFAMYRKNSIIQRQKDIEIILKEILSHSRPKSLKKSLEDFGLSTQTAQRYHPELCKMIIDRNQQYIQARKEKRIKAYEDELKSIILYMHKKGIYPSMNQINKVISDPYLFMDGHFRTLRKEILKSLGYEI